MTFNTEINFCDDELRDYWTGIAILQFNRLKIF